MSLPKIIGVAGTNGSGKDTVMNYLAREHGYFAASATVMLAAELERDGLPTDRIHKAERAAQWRREHGMGVIVHKAFEEYERIGDTFAGLTVGSLRHPAEAELIHERRGTVIWLDADANVRYARVQAALEARGNRIEDRVSFEQFMADEQREMTPIGDSATLNVLAVKAMADIELFNNGSIGEMIMLLTQRFSE